jgi:hypothetical protein
MSASTHDGATTPLSNAVRGRFGRPTVGPGAAAKAVAEDTSALFRAEIDLAKTELAAAAKEKAAGAALLGAAGMIAFLATQALLITAGLALALVLPGWAAAGVVALGLLLAAGVLAVTAMRKFSAPAGLDATRETIEEDIAWAKTRLRG